MLVKKLPEKPVKPYIRHNDQTLSEPAIWDQGTAVGRSGDLGRPAAIRSSSWRLTCGISSGWLRNQGQNAPHQRRPRPAVSTNGTGQLPHTAKSQASRKGMRAPPHRLNIQMAPWAKPRSVTGIQSATTRPKVGKPTAWNMPNRNRTTSKNTNGKPATGVKNTARATAPVRSDQPSTRIVRTWRAPRRSPSKPPGTWKQP